MLSTSTLARTGPSFTGRLHTPLLRTWGLTALLAGLACAVQAGPFTVDATHSALVTDQATGLVWQRCAVGAAWNEAQSSCGTPSQLNWTQAFAAADAANAESRYGHGDWRVPSVDEMASLVVMHQNPEAPTIDRTAFPDVSPNAFLGTATLAGSNSTSKWLALLNQGRTVGGYLVGWGYPIYLVRSPSPAGLATVSATAGEGGSISPAMRRIAPGGPDHGSAAHFTVAPAPGNRIDTVTTGCNAPYRVDGLLISVQGRGDNTDCAVQVTFKTDWLELRTVAEPPSGGQVACSPNPVAKTLDATCTATPAPGYRVASWAGACAGAPLPAQAGQPATCPLAQVMEAATVQAFFERTAAAVPATLTVATAADIGPDEPLTRAQCTPAQGDRRCTTLRDAINSAGHGDTIVFAPELDGQRIALARHTNCLTMAQTLDGTCAPPADWPLAQGSYTQRQVSQFGPSAFFISGRTLTIDATANGLRQGVVLSATEANTGCRATSCFRLFDIDAAGGSGLVLRGLTLAGGVARGGDSVGGGGALGAGGAVFNRGQLTVERSTFTGNLAAGGSGGDDGGSGTGSAGAGVGGSARAATEIGHLSGGPNAGPSAKVTCYPGGDGRPVCLSDGDGAGGGFGGGGGYGSGANAGGFGGGGAATTPRGFDAVPGAGGFGGGGSGQSVILVGETDPKRVYPQGANAGFGGGKGGGRGGGGAGMGGAIFNNAGQVRLINVTLVANEARGGHSANYGAGGSGYGGALFNYAGSLVLQHATLVDNSATAGTAPADHGAGLGYGRSDDPELPSPGQADGSAIYSLGDGQCRAGGNTCRTQGSALLQMDRSIAAGTGASTASQIVVHEIHDGPSTSQGTANLVTSQSGFSGGVVGLSNPGLAALPASWHGGIADVLVPGAASPVLDRAACDAATTVDQRGVARPQSQAGTATPCDIGAVERRAGTATLKVEVTGLGGVSGLPQAPAQDCRADSPCEASFQDEAAPFAVTLTARPDTGQVFVGWQGACTGTATTCTLALGGVRSVQARFAPTSSSGGTPGGDVTLSLAGAGCVLAGAPAFGAAPDSGSEGAPVRHAFPYGQIGFQATACQSGGAVQVTLDLPGPLPAGTRLFKRIGGQWVDWSAHTVFGDKALQFTVTDSTDPATAATTGDNDPLPGEIDDPVLIAVPLAPPAGPGAAPIPALGPWALAGLSLLLGAAAWAGRRPARRRA